MTTEAKIGLLVPGSFAGTPPSMQDFTQFFRRADELGFDSLWVIDRIFHDINILEPMTLLTCAAAVTNRIRLGTSSSVPWTSTRSVGSAGSEKAWI